MPLPLFFVRRSARRRPEKTRRLTSARYSSLRWNSSSKRSSSSISARFGARRKSEAKEVSDERTPAVDAARAMEARVRRRSVGANGRLLGCGLRDDLEDRVDDLIG